MFKVKSKVQDYQVEILSEWFERSLNQIIKDGDVIIIDRKVKEKYNYFLNFNKCNLLTIDATELQKSFLHLEWIFRYLIENGFTRSNRLIAIGGGITQDVTSFVASTLYRGVSWIYYPTTLLSQADSCIGSKTSVNFGKYKNQLGGFYPPTIVNIDVTFLKTLDDKEVVSGLGEMCHYFLIDGKESFDYFCESYPKAVSRSSSSYDTLSDLIEKSLNIKKKMIEIDEFDKKERQIFNYGHTFGHAIETLTNYKIPHGVAVSFGMDIANYVSMKLGYVSEEFYKEVHNFLKQVYKRYSLSDIEINDFLDALSKDKKNKGKELGLILTNGYGQMYKKLTKSDEKFREYLNEYLEAFAKETPSALALGVCQKENVSEKYSNDTNGTRQYKDKR